MLRRLIILIASLLPALLSASFSFAGAEQQSAALIPSLSLERVVRLAQSYGPAPANTLLSPFFSAPPKIDGDLSDWPAPQPSEEIALGEGDDLSALLRSGWDASSFYLAAEIKDEAILPAPPDDPLGGDLLALSLSRGEEASDESAVENSQTFILTTSPAGPLLLKGGPRLEQLPNEDNLAISDSTGRRAVELRLPWEILSPLNPTSEGGLRLSVRLEDRDSPEEVEAASLDTTGEEARLVMLPSHSAGISGRLSLASASIGPGDSLEGILLVDSPQPAAQVRLSVGISAQDRQRAIARISKSLPLEQGPNSFRMNWNSAGQPEGDYFLLASASSKDGEIFSLRSSFKVSTRQTIWQALGEYGKKLSAPAVLARLQKARENNPSAPVWFAVMGDLRGGEKIFQQLLEEAARQGAEFAVVTGDLVESGQPGEYLRFAKLLDSAPLPILTTTGNHDLRGRGKLYYERLFGPLNHAFDLGGYRFIILDNGFNRLTAAQLDWLETKLQGPLPKFVFLHAPPATIPQWAWHSFSPGAERFTALMEKYKPVRVLVSHIHAYDRVTQNGVDYILSGGAGAPLYPQLGTQAAFYHFVLIAAGPQGASDEVIRMAWQPLPSGKEPAKAGP